MIREGFEPNGSCFAIQSEEFTSIYGNVVVAGQLYEIEPPNFKGCRQFAVNAYDVVMAGHNYMHKAGSSIELSAGKMVRIVTPHALLVSPWGSLAGSVVEDIETSRTLLIGHWSFSQSILVEEPEARIN